MYLKKAKLPKIQPEQLTELEKKITQDEIKTALKETPSGKSPGPDGFTIKYYKKFQEQLIPKLCDYLNNRQESLLAYITIISKKGKDKTTCSSYRPIALLNADTKIYAKILASRLKKTNTTVDRP